MDHDFGSDEEYSFYAEVVAHHEAGHLIAFGVFGWEIAAVFFGGSRLRSFGYPKDWPDNLISPDATLLQRAISLYAGREAERSFLRECVARKRATFVIDTEDGSRIDMEGAAECADVFASRHGSEARIAFLALAEAEAGKIVRRNWRSVCNVAALFLEGDEGVYEGSEIQKYMSIDGGLKPYTLPRLPKPPSQRRSAT